MRIVTLNTWKNDGRYDWRVERMAEGLYALRPDVVCLQECFWADGADTAARLAAALGLEVAAEPIRAKPRTHAGQAVFSSSGLALLARRIEGRGRIDLPMDPADGERIAQWGDVAPDLRVINLHLTHLRGPQAAALRAQQLAVTLAQAQWSGGGLVVGGDFNAGPDAPELTQIAAGLDPAFPPTWHGERFIPDRPPGRTIDHLALVQPGPWRIARRFRALDAADDEGWFPSDHAAVVMDLDRTGA